MLFKLRDEAEEDLHAKPDPATLTDGSGYVSYAQRAYYDQRTKLRRLAMHMR